MTEDIEENKEDNLLHELNTYFASHGLTLSSFNLPEIQIHNNEYDSINVIDVEKLNHDVSKLNTEQKIVFESVIESIDKNGNLIFIDGPAGTGKTFLYKVTSRGSRS